METVTMTLVEFLTARLDEDAVRGDAVYDQYGDDEWPRDQAWWLREVEAKRAIVARLDLGVDTWDYENNANPENVMHEIEREADERIARHLAAVYSDHPDYDEAWRP